MENANIKRAHFNIPDLHAYYKLANRFDYYAEILAIIKKVGQIVEKYRAMGYECIALYNGDVAHQGSKSDSLNDYAVQAIKLLNSYFDECYLNFGNHEFTYHKNNPILKFIHEIEDRRVLRTHPYLTPTSTVPIIRAVMMLEYEDFEIMFTPYKMKPLRGTKKYSMLIMHDDLVSDRGLSNIARALPNWDFQRLNEDVSEFNYVFCGHAHLAYDIWDVGGTKIYNLASLGRTTAKEVIDSDRKRTIPIILSEGGYFKEVVEEHLLLHKRADVVDETQVEAAQEAYSLTKEVKEIARDLSYSDNLNPIEALLEDISLGVNPAIPQMVRILQQGRLVSWKDIVQDEDYEDEED